MTSTTDLQETCGMLRAMSVSPKQEAEVPREVSPRRRGKSMFERPREVLDGDEAGNVGASHRKVRLSMGYKADCPKCVDRVPGHNSHFIYT